MAFVKLLKSVRYRGKEHDVGSVLEVGEELAGRMILSGQAISASANEFEAQGENEEKEEAQSADLGRLTKKELEAICKELGIECAKLKKDEIIALIKEARSGISG